VFNFFKKKPPTSAAVAVINLSDRGFIGTVARMMAEAPLASGTMVLIALANLGPIMSVNFEMAKNKPGLPQTLDGFIAFLAASAEKQTDEIAKRRVQWFFIAAMVRRASERAAASPALIDAAAEIWIALAKSGALLAETVPRNALWQDDEKDWFTHIKDEKAGISYVLNHMLPTQFKKQRDIQALADEHAVFISSLFTR
jgi:hypothetical protein